MAPLTIFRRCKQRLKGRKDKSRSKGQGKNHTLSSEHGLLLHKSRSDDLSTRPSGTSELDCGNSRAQSKLPTVLSTLPDGICSGVAAANNGYMRHVVSTSRWEGETTEELLCSSQDEGKEERAGLYKLRLSVRYNRGLWPNSTCNRSTSGSVAKDALRVLDNNRNRPAKEDKPRKSEKRLFDPSSPMFWIFMA